MKFNMLVVEHLVEKLMALALGLIVLLVFSNVVGRYALGTSFAGAEELSRLLFVWLVFLGAILTLRRRAHLGVELVQARLPRKARRVCAVITHLLTLYALWLFLVGSWAQTEIGLHNYSTVLRFPNAFYRLGRSGLRRLDDSDRRLQPAEDRHQPSRCGDGR